MAVQWPEEHKDRFVVRIDQSDPDVSGYAFASVSDIATLVADINYALGEDSELARPFAAWRLTDVGPVPVMITERAHRPIGQVEVILTWRVPTEGGRYGTVTESGYYPMSEV